MMVRPQARLQERRWWIVGVLGAGVLAALLAGEILRETGDGIVVATAAAGLAVLAIARARPAGVAASDGAASTARSGAESLPRRRRSAAPDPPPAPPAPEPVPSAATSVESSAASPPPVPAPETAAAADPAPAPAEPAAPAPAPAPAPVAAPAPAPAARRAPTPPVAGELNRCDRHLGGLRLYQDGHPDGECPWCRLDVQMARSGDWIRLWNEAESEARRWRARAGELEQTLAQVSAERNRLREELADLRGEARLTPVPSPAPAADAR